MRKYSVTDPNGNVANYSHIGVNHLPMGTSIGGNASSYDKDFDNEDSVLIGASGFGEDVYCTIGDIKEAYQILREEIASHEPRTIEEYAVCIQNTIMRYFGDFSNVDSRLSFFPSDGEIAYDKKEMGCVSSLAHQNAAMCVERAMVTQNLLIEIGVRSVFKASGIINNGKVDSHAFNLVSHEGKYYIFDVTIPTLKDDKTTPLICEIPKEVYDKMVNAHNSVGYSVEVSHYNPLQEKDYTITYDAGREDLYKVEEVITK